MMRIQKLLRQQAVYEGTGFEKEIENELKEKGVMDVQGYLFINCSLICNVVNVNKMFIEW